MLKAINWNIRPLEEKDLSDCLNLLRQLTVVGNDFTVEKAEIIFQEKIKGNDLYNIFVYEIGENEEKEKEEIEKGMKKVIGMSTLLVEQKFIHSGGLVGHVEDVVVDSNYREKGVGSALIGKCLQVGKEKGCYKVILECDEDHIGFYEKCGFKKYSCAMKVVF